MATRVSAAHAKAHLADMVANVAHEGKHYVIQRRGKPVAALVRVDELELLEKRPSMSGRPSGALALVGAWREVADHDLDALLEEIYTQRSHDTGRRVEIDG